MTIICCKVCKSPPKIKEGIDETEPLILEANNGFDTLSDHIDDIDDSNLDEKYSSNNEDMIDNLRINDELDTAKKTLLGMIVVAIGTALFCTVGAIVQHHGGSVLQLMLGRYVTQNIMSWCIWFSNPCKIRIQCNHWYGDKPYRLNIWIRGFLLFCTIFFWWRGLELVPLGDGEAILFLSPIITVIAARILLSEELPSTFILTLVITVSGLIFICQPTFIFGGSDAALSWEGILFLIGCVIAWSGACVLVRTAKKAHWLQLEITATTQSIIIWCPLVIILNQFWLHSDGLSGGDWDFSLRTGIVMVVIGILGFLALMLNVIGYQIGDATKVAWMEYLDLVFAFLYQWLYFKDIPTTWEIIGCCCLLSTCLIHLGEEYYHYLQAKKHKKTENQIIAKAKEGTMDLNKLQQTDNNEMVPLLSTSSENNKMKISKDGNKIFGLINRINVFNNDYNQINSD